MKLGKAVLLTVAGMTATSIAVWTMTGPAQGSERERTGPATDVAADPKPEPVADKSSFTAGGTLMMEGRLGHAVLAATSDSETFVSVAVTADASKRAAKRSKLNLAIVIDRSGSMKGQRLENALDAARTAIDKMDHGDIVSVLAYNTANEVIVPATALTAQNRSQIARKIGAIRAKGDTCISCGINGGMRLISSNTGAVSRILLLSDGLPTAGVRDELGFRRIAEQCRRMSVAVTTIGVDIDYNEQIMAVIARESNGRHFFVQDASGLTQIFDEEMETLQKTVATNASVAIELSDGVFVDQIFDRSFERRGNSVIVPMGAFAAADKKSVLMRVRVPRGQVGERPIASVRLDYDDLAEDKKGACTGELIALASTNPDDESEIDSFVQARVSRTETADALDQANSLFSSGDRAGARQVISARKRKLEKARSRAGRRAPRGRKAELDKNFASQEDALGGADIGFEPSANPSDGARQQKTNVQNSVPLRH